MKKYFSILTGILLAAIVSGCVVYETSYRRPVAPPDRVEVIGIAPYPEAIWVPGIWIWHRRHHEYRWRDGYWKRSRQYHHYGY